MATINHSSTPIDLTKLPDAVETYRDDDVVVIFSQQYQVLHFIDIDSMIAITSRVKVADRSAANIITNDVLLG